MPSKVVKLKSTAGEVLRSRLGCQTCRTRKLKCDEGRPICGQCQKSNRQCTYNPDGITFRHHHNPTRFKKKTLAPLPGETKEEVEARQAQLDKEEQERAEKHNFKVDSLKSFYKYSPAFDTAGQNVTWVKPPKDLTWIYVTDPNADESTTVASPAPRTSVTSDNFQQVAAHTLEALSTAATADQTSYPPQGTAYYTAANPHAESVPEYGFVRIDTGSGPSASGSNVNYPLLHPHSQSQTPSSLIDPNLEATVAQAAAQAVDMKAAGTATGEIEDSSAARKEDLDDGMGDADSRVAQALRNFNETPA